MGFIFLVETSNNLNTAFKIRSRDNCSWCTISWIKNLLFTARDYFFPPIRFQIEKMEIVKHFEHRLSSKHIQFILESKKAHRLPRWRTISTRFYIIPLFRYWIKRMDIIVMAASLITAPKDIQNVSNNWTTMELSWERGFTCSFNHF